MATPSLQDEVTFISSINPNGTLAKYSFYGWDNNNPATYNSGWTTARKWGGTTAGSSGGTVSYYFNPGSNWSTTEKNWFAAGLALWSAVANIKFVQTTSSSSAGITFNRTNDSGSYTYAIYNPTTYNACTTGGTVLGSITYSSVNIDTTGTSFGPINGLASQGGFTVENLLHEEGHALGLGHSGPYNGSVGNGQQYSPYDNRRWSIMSYFDPGNTGAKYYSQTPVKGGFNGSQPTTMMPLDIMAIQQLYGAPTTTPLDGGEVFGFNCNITGAIRPFFDFTQNTKPVITIWDKGTNNTLDLSGFGGSARVNLNPGTFSSTCGLNNNIGIAFGTQINKLVCTSGNDTVSCNNFGDTVIGGAGNDTIYVGTGNDNIDGSAGSDTVVFSGNRGLYKVVHNSNGTLTVSGNGGGTDTLTSVETLKFADQTVSAASAAPTIISNAPQPATVDVLATSSLDLASSSTTLTGTILSAAGGALSNVGPQSPDVLPGAASSPFADQIGWDAASPYLAGSTGTTTGDIFSKSIPDLLASSASTALACPSVAPAWISADALTKMRNTWHLQT